MGVITDLDTRIKALANISGIGSCEYDRIDSINEDSKNNYPMLIYRVTGETNANYRNNKSYPVMVIDFYLSDLYLQGDTNSIPQKIDGLRDQLDEVIKSIGKSDNDFELLESASAEYGWEQHNDELVVVKRTASIRGFTCITKQDQ